MTTINNQEDFLRALEDNPQWKAAVRALILGEELLQLPARFNAFADKVTAFVDQMTLFVEEQKQVNTEQRQFNTEQKQFNAEQRQFNAEQRQYNAGFARRLTRIEGDISNFRGAYARDGLIRNPASIAAEMDLEYVRSVPPGELVQMSRMPAGDVPKGQLRSFRDADLVIEASDGSITHYIAVEASYTADQRDTDRAVRNAQFLEEFTGQTARAVIASVRNDRYVSSLVESGAVSWYPLQDRGPEPE